ncbi:TonB-dependent receptor domain-containing protein [Gluconacetobacter sacchari]|uniref:TonB-dependent receptor n=2 Tax=Gluconacetobacter sacchari TaxID=92759 RepID=A0A7W4IBH4_9PROT|nr:TonB-dependent receptor [Gluconacetobacter sacchari]MBB2159773.1 TonB-dependent receptor [Gluconacetobacter sacchari]
MKRKTPRSRSAFGAAFPFPPVLGLAVAAMVALPLVPPCVAAAQSVAVTDFSIPAQALSSALTQFSRQSGVHVAVDGKDVENLRSSPVQGKKTPEQALDDMLAGTGVVVRAKADGVWMLQRAARAAMTPAGLPEGEAVIVTGRASTRRQRKIDASYAITTISQEDLRVRGTSSVSEALKNTPGFWVEASGGEVGANIRARGIPVDGYGSVQLEEDGLPIQSDPALGYLNADDSFRIDETMKQIQVVRGGPSSIVAQNAPGGLVNFLSRRGTSRLSGLAKQTFGDDGLYRTDAWLGGPAGAWRWSLGGFYRVENGVRDPGFRANSGGQIRANISRDFSHGGSVFVDYKHLDDRTAFFTDIPVTYDKAGNIASLPGFNANTGDYSSSVLENAYLPGPGGSTKHIDLQSGIHINLNQVTAGFRHDLADGWHLTDTFRYRAMNATWTVLSPSAVTDADKRLAGLGDAGSMFAGATGWQLRYANDPAQPFSSSLAGNNYVTDASLRAVWINEHEVMNDFKLEKSFAFLGHHDVAAGAFVTYFNEDFTRYSANLLLDTTPHAQLLNIDAVNAAGDVVGSTTQNGYTRYGTEFANGSGDDTDVAGYATDEWAITKKLRVDTGVRYEAQRTSGLVEGSHSVVAGAAPYLSNMLSGNGVYTPYHAGFAGFGGTIGVNYQLQPNLGFFARFTRAYRLPSLASFITNPVAVPITQKIFMYEGGVKYQSRYADLFLTGFNTDYPSYAINNLVFDVKTGSYNQQAITATTHTYGLEFEGTIRPSHYFDIVFSGTAQNARFGRMRYLVLNNGAPSLLDYTGNHLLRTPPVMFRVTPRLHLLDGRLLLQADIEHYGLRYADVANTQRLPAYTVINFGATYAITPYLTFNLSGENLNDSLGLTEGNPRSGEVLSSQAGQNVFLARPILGRNFRLSLMGQF